MPYSSEVQQRLRIELLAQALERLEGLGVGDLGVDVHRHVDLGMPEDALGHARMHVERGEQRGTCVSRVMNGDSANARLGAARLETPIEVARLEGRTGAGREDEAGVRPVSPVRGPSLGLVLRAHAQSRHADTRSEEHTSELQSPMYLVCRLLLE